MKEKHKIAYMKTAWVFSQCSVGERLKVGAVLVKDNNIISTGYNALPRHINGPLEDENGNTRPEVRHAEKNALISLTKNNESSIGSILFVTHACCKLCTVDIVDAGIKEVYYDKLYRCGEGMAYLQENGIFIQQLHV